MIGKEAIHSLGDKHWRGGQHCRWESPHAMAGLSTDYSSHDYTDKYACLKWPVPWRSALLPSTCLLSSCINNNTSDGKYSVERTARGKQCINKKIQVVPENGQQKQGKLCLSDRQTIGLPGQTGSVPEATSSCLSICSPFLWLISLL